MKPSLLPLLTCVASSLAQPAPVIPLHTPDGARIADWQATANPAKSYLAQLYAPGGKALALLDDSPADHIHHHGLMFAIGAGEIDFWNETPPPNQGGDQIPVKSTPYPKGDGFAQTLHWTTPKKETLLEETRTVRVRTTGEGENTVYWVEWQSVLTPAQGQKEVKLWGRHYFGLGMRLAPNWATRGQFLWQNTEAQTLVRGDERLTPGRWCAVSHTLEGQPVTVAMFSDPANPRPGAWFTMATPFCYLAATYDLEKHPFLLKQGDKWSVRHAVAVLPAIAEAAALEKLAIQWDELRKMEPSATR